MKFKGQMKAADTITERFLWSHPALPRSNYHLLLWMCLIQSQTPSLNLFMDNSDTKWLLRSVFSESLETKFVVLTVRNL